MGVPKTLLTWFKAGATARTWREKFRQAGLAIEKTGIHLMGGGSKSVTRIPWEDISPQEAATPDRLLMAIKHKVLTKMQSRNVKDLPEPLRAQFIHENRDFFKFLSRTSEKSLSLATKVPKHPMNRAIPGMVVPYRPTEN